MEHEIKILRVDPAAVTAALEAMGARKVFDAERTITHFDTADRAFARMDTQIKVTQEGSVKLTVTARATSDSPEERKTKVGENIASLLELLNLHAIAEVKAHRISYELSEVDFDIDLFPGIPPFLEIDASEAGLGPLIGRLGLEGHERVRRNTPGVFTYFGKEYFAEFRKA